jgi:hypothetical protein
VLTAGARTPLGPIWLFEIDDLETTDRKKKEGAQEDFVKGELPS